MIELLHLVLLLHPSNMVLFVVGDVDPKRICNVIEEHENRRHKTNQPSIQRGAIKMIKRFIT
jgi:predicted Zn-dependent peptidase